MEDRQMKVGIWFYGLGTVLTGILNIAWGSFDASHQPIAQALSKNLPGGIHILAHHVAGAWLVRSGSCNFAGVRSARIGAAASRLAYLIFAALCWACRYYAGIHARGWQNRRRLIRRHFRAFTQQLMLVARQQSFAASTASPDSLFQKERPLSPHVGCSDCLPSSLGIFHVIGIRVFASIVPHWMSFGYLWAALTGIAFFLAGCAICSGKMDVLALRLLALMLLLFEGLVEIPPIFTRLHNEATWGAAIYNVTAIGACWIFAEFLASRTNRGRIGAAGNVARSRPDTVVA